MKKNIPVLILLLSITPSYSITSEVFENNDVNSIKAGISKYILSRGGNVIREDYNDNTFKAVETVVTKNGTFNYTYIFNIAPLEQGARLDLTAYKSSNPDPSVEKQVMQDISSSIKGRFLYGLGFEFDYYDSPNGKIKAPKGKDTGIKLTLVKYDALKKGLKVGDVIVKINNRELSEIPIKEFSSILNAKNYSDNLTLTVKRGEEFTTVTLTPRLSNSSTY